MLPFPGVRTFGMFSGVYAVPTIILMKLCYFISTSIFKHAYSIGVAVTTVLCMVNLQLGYYQPANHYILDLRPEYGDDIVEIATAIFQSFTDQLPFLTKTKRRHRRGQIKKFTKICGWRPQIIRQRRKVFGRKKHRAVTTAVSQALPPISLQESTTDASSTIQYEVFEVWGSVQDSDVTVDTEILELLGQSSCILESSNGVLTPEAQV